MPRSWYMITNSDFNPDFLTRDGFELPTKDKERYSVRKFISGLVNHDGDGLEDEVTRSAKKVRHGNYALEGGFLPLECLVEKGRRDMTVNSFGNGGALVGTTIADNPIELLTNKICTTRLGAGLLTGLTGNFAFPRITSGATAQSVAETGQVASSTPTVDQEQLTPHRVSVSTTFSKQLLYQSSVQIENWLRAHLMKMVAIKLDYLTLNGQGSNSEPQGILNTPGIGSVSFGGAATYANILQFETALATANADQPGAKFGYLTSPAARNKLKGAAVALTGASTVSARPIWDAGNFSDPSDGLVNGYRAASTNQVLNNVMFFGDWTQVLLCMFGSGLDVTSDIYTQAATGEVKLTLSAYIDIAVLHPQSFCVSADSAAQ